MPKVNKKVAVVNSVLKPKTYKSQSQISNGNALADIKTVNKKGNGSLLAILLGQGQVQPHSK